MTLISWRHCWYPVLHYTTTKSWGLHWSSCIILFTANLISELSVFVKRYKHNAIEKARLNKISIIRIIADLSPASQAMCFTFITTFKASWDALARRTLNKSTFVLYYCKFSSYCKPWILIVCNGLPGVRYPLDWRLSVGTLPQIPRLWTLNAIEFHIHYSFKAQYCSQYLNFF